MGQPPDGIRRVHCYCGELASFAARAGWLSLQRQLSPRATGRRGGSVGWRSGCRCDFRTVDPRTNFEITPRINSTYFPNETDEDSTDYYLNADFSNVTLRRRFNVPFLYSQEDVVDSELPGVIGGTDLGDPDQGDSGRFLVRNRRNFFRIAPAFEYDLSQRYRLELDAHYLQADFDNTLPGAQQDFSEVGAGAGFGFITSPRSTLYLRALGFQYETTEKTDAFGGVVEWNTQYSRPRGPMSALAPNRPARRTARATPTSSPVSAANGRLNVITYFWT